MGLFERLFPRTSAAVNTALIDLPIRSPWSTGQLTKVVVGELAGIRPGSVTREQLIRIPAVSRGRGLVCGTLARYPLTLWQYGEPDSTRLPTPAWMTSTTPGQAPALRNLWTLDDLLFSGLSLWAAKRDGDGQLLDAARVPPREWTVDPNTYDVLINGRPVTDPSEVILFEGPQEGLCTIAEESAAGSRDLSNAWRQRVSAPLPMVVVRQTDPNAQLADTEIDKVLKDVEAARAKSGTVFVPDGYELDAPGSGQAPDLYVAGRNADRLDWANLLQLPASMLEGSMSTASLTYSTAEGSRSEFIDYSLAYWAMAFEGRLSQDDVTEPGTYTRIDLTALATPIQAGTNPATED